jgi:drug/metabolite transporter (DMT)-like permease
VLVTLVGAMFGISYYTGIGWLAPIFLARGFTALFLLAHAGRRGTLRWRDPPPRAIAAIALIAALDTGGYVFFNVGVRHAQTSVVATASTAYAVVPILMGVWLLRERPDRMQWLGVAIVGGGLVLLGLGA